MWADFRASDKARKIRNRIAYLQSLSDSHQGTWSEEQAEAMRASIEAHQHMLDELRDAEGENEAPPAEASYLSHEEAPLPSEWGPAGGRTATRPLYLPPDHTLHQWRQEAREAQDAHGAHSDHPRRVLVLVDVVQELLTVLEELDVELVRRPKDRSPLGRAEETSRLEHTM